MAPSECDKATFAVYQSVLDHRKIQHHLNMVADGEIRYESPQELACDLWNRSLAGEFYPDKARVECGNSRLPDDQEIRIFLDGNMWCALRGPDLQEGESGFGSTPEAALADLLGETDENTDLPLEPYCPLLADPDDGGALPCLGADCAWWDVGCDKCSVITIAAAISSGRRS